MGEQQVTSVARQVETAVSTALGRVRPELDGADLLVRRSDRADFQSNVALASAKRVKARPAELAAELAQALQGVDGIADVEVSGPGFLNITVGEAGWRQAAAARPTTGWASSGPSRAAGSSSTTPHRTSPRRCTSGTCARRSSATRSPACSVTWVRP